MQRITFESPDQGQIVACLIKSVTEIFRYIRGHSKPHGQWGRWIGGLKLAIFVHV